MTRVLALITMSLVLVVISAILLFILYLCNIDYSYKIQESKYQDCDIETKVTERCYVKYFDGTYIEIEVEPGESFHVYECWADGQLLGEYISKEGKSYYITHGYITVQKTSGEELKQLVKSMNDNIEKLENERAVIRVIIPGVLILLFAGVVWVSWKLLRRHHVSK